MKKVAVVGVEGSGKTVMLAGLGDLYSHPDEDGYFLSPKNFGTTVYVADKIEKMRNGAWPVTRAGDEIQGLDWVLRRRESGSKRCPKDICEVSFLDFPDEVCRAAYGISGAGAVPPKKQVEALQRYVREADCLLVLINMSRVIMKGINDTRVQETMLLTNAILESALDGDDAPRAAIVLSQADRYAETIKACGGAAGVLQKHLPFFANNYGWLDVFAASAVDKTVLDDQGNVVPAADFQAEGLRPVMEWILDAIDEEADSDSGAEEDANETEDDAGEEVGTEYGEDDGDDLEENEAEEMGDAYYFGEGVEIDYAKALEWYLKAAESGRVYAQYFVGTMYADGRGVARDDVEAVRWYRKAADQGDSDGQYSLGLMYEKGRGVVQDYVEAVAWYRKAANQGDPEAQCNLGRMYEKGYGVPQDYAESVSWYRKAASQGDVDAQRSLGWMLEKGYGVSQDYAEAVRWYRKAADGGNVVALHDLGYMYANGLGVARDDVEAVSWYRKAAEGGNAAAQNNLGYMYEFGKGVGRNYVEAERWYRKAAELGNETARKNLDNLQKAQIPPVQKGSFWARRNASSSITISNVEWKVRAGRGSIRYGKIVNQSAWDTGSLKLCIWLSGSQYHGGTLSGTEIGECIISNEPLRQGYEFSDFEVVFSPLCNPASGDYENIVTVNEYHESGNWYIVGWINLGVCHWTH